MKISKKLAIGALALSSGMMPKVNANPIKKTLQEALPQNWIDQENTFPYRVMFREMLDTIDIAELKTKSYTQQSSFPYKDAFYLTLLTALGCVVIKQHDDTDIHSYLRDLNRRIHAEQMALDGDINNVLNRIFESLDDINNALNRILESLDGDNDAFGPMENDAFGPMGNNALAQ